MDPLERLLAKSSQTIRSMEEPPSAPPEKAITAFNRALLEKAPSRAVTVKDMEIVLLRLLKSRPMTGIEIITVLNEKKVALADGGDGLIYGLLHRLETAGLIDGRWDKGTITKNYRLTETGSHRVTGESRLPSNVISLLDQLGLRSSS